MTRQLKVDITKEQGHSENNTGLLRRSIRPSSGLSAPSRSDDVEGLKLVQFSTGGMLAYLMPWTNLCSYMASKVDPSQQ